MDLHGAEHLYTLSLLAITFATVSAFVTIVRQIKGGQLSVADVHLLTTYVSIGFAQCIAAMLPSAFSLLGLNGQPLWLLASGGSALIFIFVIIRIQWERRKLATGGLSALAIATFAGMWIVVLILTVNALAVSIQGVGLHAAAIILSLAIVMWSFLRKLISICSDRSDGDWDLKRG